MVKREIEKMLNTKEAAERLDSNTGSIRMWCINRTFPNAIKFGRDWLIPETDLKGFKRRGPGRPKGTTKAAKKSAAKKGGAK
jgi:excisionase family DNA binding protein